jgi:hypothetical protein
MTADPNATAKTALAIRRAGYAYTRNQKVKHDHDIGIRHDAAQILSLLRRLARRMDAHPEVMADIYPADAQVLADAMRLATSEAEVIKTCLHPARRTSR